MLIAGIAAFNVSKNLSINAKNELILANAEALADPESPPLAGCMTTEEVCKGFCPHCGEPHESENKVGPFVGWLSGNCLICGKPVGCSK